MSGAESTYAKFSDSPLVRGDNSNFSPALYNKVGGVSGCTGATDNVSAANSNPGYNYKFVGGGDSKNYVLNTILPNLKSQTGGKKTRKRRHSKGRKRSGKKHKRSKSKKLKHRGGNPYAVPSDYAGGVPFYGYKGASLTETASLAPGRAPITMGKNTMCSGGGRKSKRRKRRRTCCKYCNRLCKKSCKCKSKGKKCKCKCKKCPTKKRHTKRKGTKKKRSRRKRMRGGYSQFLSNVPYSASYSTGGTLSASDLALANPVPHQRFINCPGN